MKRISCIDIFQSEAYVSTVALFVVCSASSKDEKIHLRLPSVWRRVWQELLDLQKERNDAEDCEVLRRLRLLLKQASPLAAPRNADRIVTATESNKGMEPTLEREVNHQGRRPQEDQILREAWDARRASASYQSMLSSRMSLPIWAHKSQLLSAIQCNQVVIVCGETGCGKSTQVPAYILEEELSHGRACKVICTEPRRISAISLAQRVSEELGERRTDLGTPRSYVGYAIRLENQINPQTKLIYATTGIVMRMLENPEGIKDITHLVLDEVHESKSLRESVSPECWLKT